MIGKDGNLQNARRRAPLHAALRVVIAILLQVVMFCFVSGLEGNGHDFRDGLNGFLFAFFPTVSILLLIPVLLRGSRGEKILAAFFVLSAAWFAFMGWTVVVGGLFG